MKTLFLTGVPGALASVIRDTYLSEGWRVAGFGRTHDELKHDAYSSYEMDATNEASVSASFGDATRLIGTPDAVIATVGGVRSWKPIADTSLADFRDLFELNLQSFFLTAREAMRLMTGTGSIISIGAESALHPTANKGAYVASKVGVMALTKTLAKEGRARGITANSIVPTVIRTAANEEWGAPEDLPKWTSPEDIARMCLFLCSEHGRSVNGSWIEMPGGL